MGKWTFGLLDGFELLKDLGAAASSINVTSGGSKSNFWVQMIADAFQVPSNRLDIDEGPAFGAAILAGVGTGVWSSVSEACRATIRIKETVSPTKNDYSTVHKKYQNLYNNTKGWNRDDSSLLPQG